MAVLSAAPLPRRTLADVRAFSARVGIRIPPGERFRIWLPEAGVAYVYLPQLGGLRAPIAGSPNGRLGEIDPASQDVIIEVLRELEKQLWMIRAQFGHAGRS